MTIGIHLLLPGDTSRRLACDFDDRPSGPVSSAPPDLAAEALARATAALALYESPSGVLIGGAAWLVTASA